MHQIGLRIERAAVEAAGISLRAYEGFVKKHEKPIEEEKLHRVPRDLDLTPYRDLQDFPLLQALVTKERSNSKPRRTAARERPAACGGRKATVRAYRGRYRLCSGAWVRAMLQARHSKICCSQR